jgi:hypothetical protein
MQIKATFVRMQTDATLYGKRDICRMRDLFKTLHVHIYLKLNNKERSGDAEFQKF